jgi:hypothetical protein
LGVATLRLGGVPGMRGVPGRREQGASMGTCTGCSPIIKGISKTIHKTGYSVRRENQF